MFFRDAPPKGRRPSIGRVIAVHQTAPPEGVTSYIKDAIEKEKSLYNALYDAYDGFNTSEEVGDWIARNEDTFAKEWLKAKGVI